MSDGWFFVVASPLLVQKVVGTWVVLASAFFPKEVTQKGGVGICNEVVIFGANRGELERQNRLRLWGWWAFAA